MKHLITATHTAFVDYFGAEPQCTVQAPGRVNIVGEHTDYNDGYVLPCAIDYYAVIACTPRADNVVNVYALDYEQQDSFAVADTIEHSPLLWANYIRGVVQCLCKRGYIFAGADIVVSGNVPQGAGLSSSAALEVAVGQAFKTMYSLAVSQTEIALNGQQAENEFVGCNCGIMDQFISANGQHGSALLIDCRDLSHTAVRIPDTHAVMVVNSNKKRGLVESEYNTRRAQCEEAAARLQVSSLRDADMAMLNASDIDQGSELYKRAHYVINENARTVALADALNANDVAAISAIMAASHRGMRDDFAITVEEIDTLVEIISGVLGAHGGVRMTGGGFGGCVVALVPHDMVDTVSSAIRTHYHARTGLTEDIFLCQPSAGAAEVHD